MNAKVLASVLPHILEAQVTPLIWGWHGIGKSQIMGAVAEKMYGKTYKDDRGIEQQTMIEIRLGQMEVSDLVGIPRAIDTGGGVKTVWAAPSWWPEGKDARGVVFLDEFNRAATTDVLQAVFQLVLDRRLHTHRLPPGFTVAAACNPLEGDYAVTPLDPALMDRFVHLPYSPTISDWTDWAARNIKSLEIRGYVAANGSSLGIHTMQDMKVTPSPRSWEMLGKIFLGMSDDEIRDVGSIIATGLVGLENAHALMKYIQSALDVPIPASVFFSDFEQVRIRLSRWSTTTARKKVVRTDLINAQWVTVLAAFEDESVKVTDKTVDTIMEFIKLVPREVVATIIASTGEKSKDSDSMRRMLLKVGTRITEVKELRKIWIDMSNFGQTMTGKEGKKADE